jgi:hypothetical protein
VETLCEWFMGPTPLGNVDWPSVEAELGTSLPTDYRHLWERTRLISLRWLHLASPTATADNGSLADLRGLVPDLFEAGGCAVDWPAAEDLMPWGHIDVIPMFCWDMSSASDPDDWHTLVFDTDVCRMHRTDRTMTECVRDMIGGALTFDFVDTSDLARRPLAAFTLDRGWFEVAVI